MIETRYAIVVNEKTNEVKIGVGCTEDFYEEIGMTKMLVEQHEDGKWYKSAFDKIPLSDVEIAKYNARIEELKKELANTNDLIIECVECKLVKAPLPYDIKELHEQRQAWRDEIALIEQKLS